MVDDTAPLVLHEVRNRIALITLSQPRQRNALRYESWTALSGALAETVADDNVRGIVLAGAEGFFSAGGDLKTGPAHGTGPLGAAGRVEHAQRVMEQLRAVPVPTIAAVEGAAVGLGWSLALSCDLIVCAADAYFSAPFVARAVVPDGGLAWRLTQQLGKHRAAALLLRGTRLSAAEAERVGLVTEVVEAGCAIDRSIEIAGEIGESDSGAVEMTKRLIASAEAPQLAAFYPLELAMATVAQQRSVSGEARGRWSK